MQEHSSQLYFCSRPSFAFHSARAFSPTRLEFAIDTEVTIKIQNFDNLGGCKSHGSRYKWDETRWVINWEWHHHIWSSLCQGIPLQGSDQMGSEPLRMDAVGKGLFKHYPDAGLLPWCKVATEQSKVAHLKIFHGEAKPIGDYVNLHAFQLTERHCVYFDGIDVGKIGTVGMDTVLLLTFLPQSASNFKGLTTHNGAPYWGFMGFGVQPVAANSALVPGIDKRRGCSGVFIGPHETAAGFFSTGIVSTTGSNRQCYP